MPDQYRRDPYQRQLAEMKQERASFDAHWKELSEFVAPRRGRYAIQDRNRGDKRYNHIINSAATQAHKVARAGMLAGSMSPARPWFNLRVADADLMEFAPVKDWLFRVEQQMRDIFNQSNFYGMSGVMIGEMLQFGTGCMMQVDDFEDVARFYAHTIGSYYIAQDDRYETDTLAREFEWTTAQIVKKFGLGNVSLSVKQAYDKSNYGSWYPLCHFIAPNREITPGSKRSKDKRFRSVYFEPGQEDKNKFLSEAGYEEFPAFCPRWDVTGEDIYGTDCPAMTALGDIKSLQLQEKRKAQGIDKMTNPPMRGPSALKNVPITSLPGGVNIYEGTGEQKLEPVYMVKLPLQELRADSAEIENRIKSAFFNDLFLAISTMEGIQPRNQFDLVQRNEERLLQLGPVLEHMHGEFLARAISRTFNQMARAGILPPPPQEIQGKAIAARFISTLAMAQRAVATGGLDRLAGAVVALVAAGIGGAAEKLDAEQFVDEYANALGVPPTVIVPDEIVKARREEAAKVRAQEQAMQMAQGAANTAKMASDAKTSDPSVLTALMGAKK